MKQKCIILIDGSNFYFKLKDLGLHNLLYFNFSRFVHLIARSYKVVSVCYYVGRIRQDGSAKTNKLFDGQQKLLGNLKKHGILYQFGYLLKSGGVYHEKGVDVQIAVDMLVTAYENVVDRIILISSDTDLAPAIKKAREKGKTVEYIGFSHKPSVAMVSFCSESTLLKKEDLLPFIKSK
ncbi:MAG: NYN domain-containing protein [Candidatus Levybacteria bacterium]|nr:NYN domain-containing protein [Candidatus Levybacteria bacterium]MBI3070144.1 NYN domain-containing protein [Candidatus Levybacteria bacterium]MBI3092835.1 NYN domain-containing protein [Candidatus Levybacteria bacterium]